jgi:hypothetical protein
VTDDDLAQDLERALRGEGESPGAEEAPHEAAPEEAAVREESAVPEEAGAAPGPTRRADVEILTSAALERFLQDDHQGARRAASMALELDPRNRKARELLKILGALG